MSDFRSQLWALGDSESVQYGVVSSVVAAAGTLIRPVRSSDDGRFAYRIGFAAFTALALSAWPRNGRPAIPNLPVRIGMAAAGAALAYRFAESGARLDAWFEDRLRHLGTPRPRIVMALGAGGLSAGVFLLERYTNGRYREDQDDSIVEASDEPDQENSLPWEDPGAVHSRLYAEMVSVSGKYGPVLAEQFANSQIRRDTHCDHGCFDIRVAAETPRLPRKAECPMPFGARDEVTGSETNVMVLLWHERGLVSGVEISWFVGDSHPPPEQLTVFD